MFESHFLSYQKLSTLMIDVPFQKAVPQCAEG